MSIEFCFGIVPLKKVKDHWEVLLLEHKKGFWGFPKGHPSFPEESPEEIARREFSEETGLEVVHFLQVYPLIENYHYQEKERKIHKHVTYFLAEVKGTEKICPQEIKSCRWLTFDQAIALITFDQARNVCIKANELLYTLKTAE